jgi:transposase
LADLVQRGIKAPRAKLVEALRGRVSGHHRFLLKLHLSQIDGLRAAIKEVDAQLGKGLEPFRHAAALLNAIPSVGEVMAHVILGEIGVDMARFPTAGHLISWVGQCPRMDESDNRLLGATPGPETLEFGSRTGVFLHGGCPRRLHESGLQPRGAVAYACVAALSTTSGLLALSDWLTGHGVTHVAMEATGVYWKPVWHVLEDSFELVLANAMHIKNVPGRKTDVNDAMWIADLLAHGLIRGSFVPPEPVQELRALTRTRRQIVREKAAHVQRIDKVLQDANLKLGSVLTDIMGLSGRAILNAIVAGEADPARLATLVDRRVKASQGALREACAAGSPSTIASCSSCTSGRSTPWIEPSRRSTNNSAAASSPFGKPSSC